MSSAALPEDVSSLVLSEVFGPHLEEVSSARHFVAAACATFGVTGEVVDVVVLLVSEVVTNAFIHGRSEARVVVRSDGRCIHVEVGDDNSRHPRIQAADPDAVDGRGLQILALASVSWGVRTEEFGKAVWFAVGCPHPHQL